MISIRIRLSDNEEASGRLFEKADIYQPRYFHYLITCHVSLRSYCRLLLFVFLIPGSAALAQVKSRRVSDIEQINFLIRNIYAADTVKLNAIADSIAAEGDREKTEYARLFAFVRKGARYGDSINNVFTQWAPVFTTYQTPGAKALFKFYYGESFYNVKELSTGMEIMLEAASEFENLGYENIPCVDIPFYLLSNHYYDFKNYRKCIDYGELAIKYLSPVVTGIHNTLGMAYQHLGKYDSAALRFKQMMQLAKQKKSTVWYSIASGNLGRTYCLKGDLAQGIPLLARDIEMGRSRSTINSALSAAYIAEAYINQKNADSALHYINLAREIVIEKNLWDSDLFYVNRFCYYYYVQLANYYKLTGNYKQAVIYSDTATLNKDKYEERFNRQFLTSAERKIQRLRYQQSIDLLTAEKRNQELQKLTLFIVLTAVVIIGFLFQRGQIIKKRKEKQIMLEREANLLLKKEKAEQQLENARQQLQELLHQFKEKNELNDNVRAGLEKASKDHNEQATQILTDLSNASLLTNQDWQLFRQRFEKVYPGFFSSLAREIPDITPAEERMLALLKLKVSYRQMAFMLGISPQSVRTAKYRLRKKLEACNQSGFLANLS
jgi:tetratricopeptide (TPR) repeat protein